VTTLTLKKLSTIAPVAAAAVLLVSYGVAEGWWTNRWRDSDNLETAFGRAQSLPMTLGNWNAQPLELTARELAVGQIKGSCYRRYVNRATGKAVTMLLVCGRPGPIAAHAPDVCFAGAGYEEVSNSVRRPVPAAAAGVNGDFHTANFRKQDGPIPHPLRVSWSWNAGGDWQTPASPRFSFARYPVLYKLYLVQQLDHTDDQVAQDACDDFMRQLLPELQRRLFPSTESPHLLRG
jgi:hypothetical protein